MDTTQITFRGLDLEITYHYNGGHIPLDRDEQPDPECVQIEKIEHKCNDVFDVFVEFASVEDFNELQNIIIQKR